MSTIQVPPCWLTKVESRFEDQGDGGRNLFYLMKTMLAERRMSFTHFLSDAASGHGCTVHEGLSYSLDQDWDDPAFFDEVKFFFGDMEVSQISIKSYLFLLNSACDAYLTENVDDRESVLRNIRIISERYSRFL